MNELGSVDVVCMSGHPKPISSREVRADQGYRKNVTQTVQFSHQQLLRPDHLTESSEMPSMKHN